MPMKILQTLPSLRRGDAVGNDAMAINRALLKMGYDAELYALDIQASCQREARPYQKMKLRKEDILLYHNAAGSKLTDDFAEAPCRKIMIYHNITPPQFFRGYSIHGAWAIPAPSMCARFSFPFLIMSRSPARKS